MKFIKKIVFERPITCLLLSMTSIIGLSFALTKLKANYSVRSWFSTTDPLVKQLDFFEKTFGNDETAIVIVRAKNGVFHPESLKKIDEITQEILLLTGISSTESISNHNFIESQEDDIFISPIIDLDRLDDKEYLETRSKLALNDPVISKHLISEDQKNAAIFAKFAPSVFEKPNYQQITLDLRELAKKHNNSDFELILLGSGIINDAFREVSTEDITKIMPYMILFIAIFMWFRFRSLYAIIIPLFLWIAATLSTYSLSALIGINFNNLTSALPGIMIAVALADSIHVLFAYFNHLNQGKKPQEASIYSFEKNFSATLLTSISTALGFFSLSITDLVPIQELGVLSGIGTLLAWLFTIFAIFPILVILKPKSRIKNSKFSKGEWSKPYYEFLERNSSKIIISTLVLIVISLIGGTKVVINADPVGYLKKGVPARDGTDYAIKTFNGLHGPEILIDSGAPDEAKSGIFLEKVEKYLNFIQSYEEINNTQSILDIIFPLNKAMHGDDQNYYRLPENKKTIGELLLFYQMGTPQDKSLDKYMSFDGRYLRASIFWSVLDSSSSLKIIKDLEDKAIELGLDVKILGKLTLYHRMNSYIVDTFFKTLLISIFVISLFMSFVFKSFSLGFIAMIPNIVPLISGAGFIGIIGLDVNIGTSIVSAICLGIAVDDTIHILVHFLKNYHESKSYKESLITLFANTAIPLIYTTILLVVGFGIFTISNFVPNAHFGILCAFVLSITLVFDLIVFPVLIIWLGKNKKV